MADLGPERADLDLIKEKVPEDSSIRNELCRGPDIRFQMERNPMADTSYKPTALVVEDDEMQRLATVVLLQEAEMNVIQCESGEAAELILNRQGGCLCLMFTDVNLSGTMTGTELAVLATERFPGMKVIVTSGQGPPALPAEVLFMAKPWNPAELRKEARASLH